MKKIVAYIRHDSFTKWSLITTTFAFLCMLIFTMYSWQRLPPSIPLFYSLPWGEEQLAPPLFLIIFGGVIFLMHLLNSGISILIDNASHYYARVILLGSTFLYLLALITIIQIVLLMT